jgi:hypothetical protein
MSFENKLSVTDNMASMERNTGEYKITVTVERLDGKPIDENEARRVLTSYVGTIFNQAISL